MIEKRKKRNEEKEISVMLRGEESGGGAVVELPNLVNSVEIRSIRLGEKI